MTPFGLVCASLWGGLGYYVCRYAEHAPGWHDLTAWRLAALLLVPVWFASAWVAQVALVATGVGRLR